MISFVHNRSIDRSIRPIVDLDLNRTRLQPVAYAKNKRWNKSWPSRRIPFSIPNALFICWSVEMRWGRPPVLPMDMIPTLPMWSDVENRVRVLNEINENFFLIFYNWAIKNRLILPKTVPAPVSRSTYADVQRGGEIPINGLQRAASGSRPLRGECMGTQKLFYFLLPYYMTSPFQLIGKRFSASI